MKEKDYSALIGKIAVTDTELSPSGTVLIDNEIYEAKTDGEFIERSEICCVSTSY